MNDRKEVKRVAYSPDLWLHDASLSNFVAVFSTDLATKTCFCSQK